MTKEQQWVDEKIRNIQEQLDDLEPHKQDAILTMLDKATNDRNIYSAATLLGWIEWAV